jgi:hypothetical protein
MLERSMSEFLLLLYVSAGLLLAATFWLAARPERPPVRFTYPDGVELVGSGRMGRLRFSIVQWMLEPARSGVCPIVLHLPEGDLGGNELCHWEAPTQAMKLGASGEVTISPTYGRSGTHKDVVGVRVGLFPGGRPIEVTILGMRVQLPLSEADALTFLGEPVNRTVLQF